MTHVATPAISFSVIAGSWAREANGAMWSPLRRFLLAGLPRRFLLRRFFLLRVLLRLFHLHLLHGPPHGSRITVGGVLRGHLQAAGDGGAVLHGFLGELLEAVLARLV